MKLTIALSFGLAALAADPDGAAIYKLRCSMCHDLSAETRAPAPSALKLMSPENIVRALETGAMKEQGASMTALERRTVAEYLTGKTIGAMQSAAAGMCADARAPFPGPQSGDWNGWSPDLANTRFQKTGLTADQVPRLKLKWAFGFANTFVAHGQPVVVGGRIFVPSANRHVYSLDAKSGCQYWSFEAEAPIRTAVAIAMVKGEKPRQVAFFGDQRANAYAVDASNGELLWRTHIDDNPHARITGALRFYEGRVFVPLVAAEEGPPMNPQYECCTSRGGLIALDAQTGKQIWKTYTITETPQIVGKTKAGANIWGPSGASIWSAPTIDEEKKIIYAGTGDNFSGSATAMSDAVVAFDLQTGKILWSKQLTADDVFNMACVAPDKSSCPEAGGPDVDIGSSPILVKTSSGKRILLVGQKSGVMHALDPDNKGAILWQTRIGKGGYLGGIQWGSATDGRNVYAALSDIAFIQEGFAPGQKRIVDPKAGGGLFALKIETGEKVWAAPPPVCGDRPNCSPAQSAAITAIPGVVFSGSLDGHLRAYSTRDGKVIWDFDTARDFTTVNGVAAKGGSMDGPGPAAANGMLYVSSGYGAWGGLPGNVLLAFGIDEK